MSDRNSNRPEWLGHEIFRVHAAKIVSLLLVILTLAVYWQVGDHGFINYDDNLYVTENRIVRDGLTMEGVAWAFTEFHASNWHPLTWLSHMADVQFFGMDPGAHHLVNVFIHVMNALVLFTLLRRLTGSVWRSAMVAALFALHPMHVESVAWVSERKDVLSTFFFLLTLLFYAGHARAPSAAKFTAVLAAMTLAVLSKPMAVTLPFVLLLIDFWPLRRLAGTTGAGMKFPNLLREAVPLIREKTPLFLLAALSCIVTVIAQSRGGAVISMEALDTATRIGNAINSYVLYVVKLIVPLDMAVHYPHPRSVSAIGVTASLVLMAGVSALLVRAARRFPYLLFGWLFYLGTLVPVIGFVQVGTQSMADRYTYIPYIGLFIMLAWGVRDLLRRTVRQELWAACLACIVLPALAVATWVQAGYWKDSVTLFERTLAVTEGNTRIHTNLGNAFDDRGQAQAAIEQYLLALEIDPGNAPAHTNLGKVLDARGDTLEAIRHFELAIRHEPRFKQAHNNMGNALVRLGEWQQAIRYYRQALEIDPEFVMAHNNLGLALEATGARDRAIEHFEHAIRLDPGFANAHHNLGVSFFRAGQLDAAISHLERAVVLDPDYVIARQNLERALSIRDQAKP